MISRVTAGCDTAGTRSSVADPQDGVVPCRYDDHRDQILRGGSHQAGESTGSWWGGGGGGKPKDEEDLYSYFTTSCYAGYGDGPRVSARGRVVYRLSPAISLPAWTRPAALIHSTNFLLMMRNAPLAHALCYS